MRVFLFPVVEACKDFEQLYCFKENICESDKNVNNSMIVSGSLSLFENLWFCFRKKLWTDESKFKDVSTGDFMKMKWILNKNLTERRMKAAFFHTWPTLKQK